MNQQPTTYPSDKVLGYKEFVTERLNYWRDLLVQRTEAYYEAMNRREKNPMSVIRTTSGQDMSISKICSLRVAPLQEAISTVETLEKMLKGCEANEFESSFLATDKIIDPEAGIPSPMGFQDKGEDGKQSDGSDSDAEESQEA